MSDDAVRRGAGLYVHVPFCSAICPYCDFAVTTGSRAARAAFVEVLIREIELLGDAELSRALAFDTIYFGGGTPSMLEAVELERVLAALRRHLAVDEGAWISFEINPEDARPDALRAWRDLGVRTVSLGVQSFVDSELAFLGRRHSADEARAAIARAHEAAFPIVSVDLIYGLPEQEISAWSRSLGDTVETEPDHVSAYQLTVTAGTPFGVRREKGRLTELDEDEQNTFFVETHRALVEAGFEAYEVSNFARRPESRSVHNQKYWAHAPYLGIGPSAHSFDGERRWWNERSVADWAARVERGSLPVAGKETLTRRQLALEALLLGLRTSRGVELRDFQARFGVDIAALNRSTIERLVASGLATVDTESLRLTRRGWAAADRIAVELEVE